MSPGVDLNAFLPFRTASFDAVDLVEVIEHIENQPQLIRELARVLKPGGVALISTPNMLESHVASAVFIYRLFAWPRSTRSLHEQAGTSAQYLPFTFL